MKSISRKLKSCFFHLPKLFGPVLFTAGISILALFGYIFFVILIPYHHSHDNQDETSPSNDTWNGWKWIDIACAIYLLVNIFFHYFMASMTDPGRTTADMMRTSTTESTTSPHGSPLQNETQATDVTIIDVREDPFPSGKNSFPVCRVCRVQKPPRTHHCSVCGRCILAMDHHCPWINNCVGYRNHRYFYLLLVYLVMGAVYYTIRSSPIVWVLYQGEKINWPEPKQRFQLLFMFTFLSATCLGTAILALLSWQTFLIATCQTNIDYYVNRANKSVALASGERFENVYDLGTYRNLLTFFNIGRNYSWWSLLLPIPVPPKGDGIRFQTVTDFIREEYYESSKMEKEF